MLRPPPALRPLMDYARYVRDDSIQEWGRVLPLAREGIRFARQEARALVGTLRAAREAERLLLGIRAVGAAKSERVPPDIATSLLEDADAAP